AAGACRDTCAPMSVRVRPLRHRARHPRGASRAQSRRTARSDAGAPALAYVDLAAGAPNLGRPLRAADHALAGGAPPPLTPPGGRLCATALSLFHPSSRTVQGGNRRGAITDV